jgi:hypothetical protein
MKKNMGKVDRIIRAVAAIVLLVLGLSFGEGIRYLFFALALIMAVTSAVAVCPLYYPLKITTLGRAKKAKKR